MKGGKMYCHALGDFGHTTLGDFRLNKVTGNIFGN